MQLLVSRLMEGWREVDLGQTCACGKPARSLAAVTSGWSGPTWCWECSQTALISVRVRSFALLSFIVTAAFLRQGGGQRSVCWDAGHAVPPHKDPEH